MSDITLVLPDGRQLLCHKAVLAAGSKKFAAAFTQGNLMGPVLPVEGVDATSLEAVVSSFYTGECPVTTSTVAGILDAAIKLEVTALIEACANFVRTTISPDNCCTLLESSIKYRVGSLAETCMEYLQPRFHEVISSKDFLSKGYDLIAEVLVDAAQKQPALLVLKAAAGWLAHDSMRNELQPKLMQALGVPANCTIEDILRGVRSQEASQGLSAQQNPQQESGNGLVDDSAAHLMASAARLATQMGPAAALQAANAMAATAVSLMNIPSIRSNVPILQVLPNGQLQTLQSSSLIAGLPPSLATSAASQLPQIQALQLPANSPASLAAAFGTGGLDTSLAALSSMLKRGDTTMDDIQGGSGKESWERADGMLALATVAVQEQQGLRRAGASLPHLGNDRGHVSDSGHGAGPTSKRRPERSSSASALHMRNSSAASTAAKRKRPSSAVVPAISAGLVGEDDNVPGRLYDATPASVLAVAATAEPSTSEGTAALATLADLRLGGKSDGTSRPPLSKTARDTMMGLFKGTCPELSQVAYMDPNIPELATKLEGKLPAAPVIKGICHVDNCYTDLSHLREYHLRYKICEYHLKATSILKDGIPQRFCQQCGRFHPLEAFDGTRRSCRAMLQRHNARRAKKSNDTPVGSGPGMMMMGSGGLGTLPLSRLAGPASSGSPRRGKK